MNQLARRIATFVMLTASLVACSGSDETPGFGGAGSVGDMNDASVDGAPGQKDAPTSAMDSSSIMGDGDAAVLAPATDAATPTDGASEALHGESGGDSATETSIDASPPLDGQADSHVADVADVTTCDGGPLLVDGAIAPSCGATSCDDGDACTIDACTTCGACSHVNPDFDCSRWSDAICERDALVARVSNGVRTLCSPPFDVLGQMVCVTSSTKCTAGCEIAVSLSGMTQTVKQTAGAMDYVLAGQLDLSGSLPVNTVISSYIGTVSLPMPIPFAIHYQGAQRTDCSENVSMQQGVDIDLSSLMINTPSFYMFKPWFLDALTKGEFAAPPCGACQHDGCPTAVVCNP